MATASRPLLPIIAVTLGIAVFSLMDAAMKQAALVSGVYTALLLRNFMGTAMMVPIWLAQRGRVPSFAVLKVHGLRAVMAGGMSLLYFYGLVRLPLAEGIALSFIAPLIALYLAALVLGEHVRPGAAWASLLGLGGVVLIAAVRLGSGERSVSSPEGIAAILVSAVLYAGNLVVQRHQAQLAGPSEIALFQNLIVTLILLPCAPFLFAAPSLPALAAMALSAVLATLALLLFAWGYAREQTQVLLPIEYTAFFWSALFGWLWFGEGLGLSTIAGAALIVGGCLVATRLAPAPNAVTTHVPLP